MGLSECTVWVPYAAPLCDPKQQHGLMGLLFQRGDVELSAEQWDDMQCRPVVCCVCSVLAHRVCTSTSFCKYAMYHLDVLDAARKLYLLLVANFVSSRQTCCSPGACTGSACRTDCAIP